MTRFLDLIAIIIVGVLVLLPAPGVVVFPAVAGDKTDLDRLASLEDAQLRTPDDVNGAVELARGYLRVEQPGWALAALAPFLDRRNHQVHQVASSAHATRLDFVQALAQAEQGIKICEAEGAACPVPSRIRLEYLAGLFRQPALTGTDPFKEGSKVRQMVREALRSTKPGATLGQPPGKPGTP